MKLNWLVVFLFRPNSVSKDGKTIVPPMNAESYPIMIAANAATIEHM
jgi:hypothetical protein